MRIDITVALLALAAQHAVGFAPPRPRAVGSARPHAVGSARPRAVGSALFAADDDDVAAVADMPVYDVCEELTVRGVDFSDCFEEAALRARLTDARADAEAAAAAALDGVNRNAAERMAGGGVDLGDLTADDLKAAAGEDGALPGGLDAEAAMKLMQDPEIMSLLQSPDFQEVMQDVMGGGPDAMVKHMADPNKAAMLSKFALAMQAAGLAPPTPPPPPPAP